MRSDRAYPAKITIFSHICQRGQFAFEIAPVMVYTGKAIFNKSGRPSPACDARSGLPPVRMYGPFRPDSVYVLFYAEVGEHTVDVGVGYAHSLLIFLFGGHILADFDVEFDFGFGA